MTLLRLLTFQLRSLTVILTVLLFWISFFLINTSICSAMAFPPLGNFDHVVVSVSIDFPINSKQDARFIESLMTILVLIGMRDVPWEDIFKLSACAAVSEFYEWVQVGIDVNVPHW